MPYTKWITKLCRHSGHMEQRRVSFTSKHGLFSAFTCELAQAGNCPEYPANCEFAKIEFDLD